MFNQSPLFLEFLMGKRDYPCTPWGMPTYNLFGWQKPCYLLQDGYADTFEELMRETEWHKYGTESGNPKCANCMVHSGYEASAVHDTFGSLKGFLGTVKATFSKVQRSGGRGDAEDELHRCTFQSAGADRQLAISSWQLVKARCIGSSTVRDTAKSFQHRLLHWRQVVLCGIPD